MLTATDAFKYPAAFDGQSDLIRSVTQGAFKLGIEL